MVLFNNLARALLVEKKATKRECKIKFSGYFEFWKDAKVLIEERKVVFIVQKFAHKYRLKDLTLTNCRKSKKAFELLLQDKLILFVKFSSGDIYDEFTRCLQCAIENAKSRVTSPKAEEKSKEGNKQMDTEGSQTYILHK